MNLKPRDAVLIILLALIEVAATEAVISFGLVGVERATTILFILILLNFAFVLAVSSRRRG